MAFESKYSLTDSLSKIAESDIFNNNNKIIDDTIYKCPNCAPRVE